MNRSVTSMTFHQDIKPQGGMWDGQWRRLPRESCNRILIQKQESFWPIQSKINTVHTINLNCLEKCPGNGEVKIYSCLIIFHCYQFFLKNKNKIRYHFRGLWVFYLKIGVGWEFWGPEVSIVPLNWGREKRLRCIVFLLAFKNEQQFFSKAWLDRFICCLNQSILVRFCFAFCLIGAVNLLYNGLFNMAYNMST